MPTPVGAPSGQKLEIEFTDAVWTDVSTGSDVELLFAQLQIHYGRTSPFAQPGPASLSCTLKNPLGRYTPQRQVLTDGTTPHPFWPNVLPRKRIRYSWTVAGVTYYRFFGYVKGFPPSLYSGVLPVVPIDAADRMGQLSRVTMKAPIAQEITADAPALWWPLTDDAGSTQAVQAPTVGPYPLGVVSGGPAVTFGDNGPGVGDGTGVKFTPGSASSGQYLTGTLPAIGDSELTVEVWVNAGTSLPAWATGAGTEQILGLLTRSALPLSTLYLANGVPAWRDTAASIVASASIADGGWHHLVVTRHTTIGTTVTLYVDGVSAGTATPSASGSPAQINVGEAKDPNLGDGRFQGNIGQVEIYTTALSAARSTAHASATNGYSGDTTDARIARYLGFAGLTASDWTLDAGQTTVGTYPQAGKDVVQACQDMATTEGGVFWVRWDGKARLANRRFRDGSLGNQLTADNSGFEVTAGDWNLRTNATSPRTTAQALDGVASLAVTSVASGDMSVVCTQHVDVTAAATWTWTVRASFRAAVSARNCQVGIRWLDAANAQISLTYGAAVTDTTSGWIEAAFSAVPPSNAAVGEVAVYVTGAGAASEVHYVDRASFTAAAPVLILDASVPALLDPDVWDPAFDETTLVNTSTASRSGESGTLSSQTYTDPVSAAPPPTGFGESDADVTTYTQSDQDALNLAQAQVAGNAYPAFRLNKLAVNFHAATTSLYPQLGAMEIGSLIQIINVPPAAAPSGTIYLFAEGWNEYPTPTTYRVEFDTTQVVTWRIKLNDATYGPLGSVGQTLNTALTNSPSPVSVVIATSGTNPTFTTVAGEYPMNIKIGEEVITLIAAPGGATSPQTFTGCLRGQQGTPVAAQAAGSTVTLSPATALAL